MNLDSVEHLRHYLPRPPWHPLRCYRTVIVHLGVLGLMGLLALLAPILAPADPTDLVTDPLLPPSLSHWLGSDHLGRDVLSRLLHGGRWTLSAALLSALVAAVPGGLLGLLAGFGGETLDELISRAIDVQLAFPRLLFALGIVALTGKGLLNIALATGLAGLPTVARMVRGATRAVRDAPYVEAARALGVGDSGLVRRHVLPNIIGTLLVVTTLQMGWAVLDVAALSFLGLGPPLGTPEWGTMLYEERVYLRDAPWATLAPGLTLALTVLFMNLLGDALRDALDPRNSNHC